MSYIGKNIRKIRTIKKLSQNKFAELFELSRTSVGAYEEERAEPKIETIIQIANYFGISIDALLKKELTVNELYHFNIFREDLNGNKELKKKKGKANTTSFKEGIPLVQSDRKIEYSVNLSEQSFIKGLPLLDIPGINQEVKRVFEYDGGKMLWDNKGFFPGDLLFAVPHDGNYSSNELYILIISDDIILRRFSGVKEKMYFFKTDNPSFATEAYSQEDILESWKLHAFYTLNIHFSDPTESRLVLLEKEMNEIKEEIKQLKNKK